jgi:hypothetical protein
MAKTTFTGPVRSLNGFLNSVQNETTGAYTDNFVLSSGSSVGTLSATTGDSITTFAQPAGTIISKISLICTSVATVATGDIGIEVGTSSSGAQIVATAADEILDGGTSVPAGAFYNTTLLNTTASDAAPAASPLFASTARSIFLNITNTTTPTVRGSFTWLIEYITLPPTNPVQYS